MNIVSENIRIRYSFEMGDYCVIDDYSYFSTRIKLGNFFHIAPQCAIIGGKDVLFQAGNFGGLATGVKVICGTNDFVNDICCVLPECCSNVRASISGDVILGDYVTIGANSIVMPNVHIPEGVTIGAMSFVPSKYVFEPWMVYYGDPLKVYKARNKSCVLAQANEVLRRTGV
jgi:acetyltransferase-like isoleucine patch superfamily enzyme